MLTVMKFGGSSVADLEHIRNVAKQLYRKTDRPGQSGCCCSFRQWEKQQINLIATAKQITEQPSRRELHACFQQESKYLYR